jgi:hypothetical protein
MEGVMTTERTMAWYRQPDELHFRKRDWFKQERTAGPCLVGFVVCSCAGLLAGFVGLMVANIFYQNYTFQFFFLFLGLGFSAGLVANGTDQKQG